MPSSNFGQDVGVGDGSTAEVRNPELLHSLHEYRRFAVSGISVDAQLPLDQQREATAGITKAFNYLVSLIAKILAQGAREDGWVADAEHAGYLRRQIGRTDVRVPFNLALHLPQPAAINELATYARRVQSNGNTVICLSGSVVLHVESVDPADLDLCEYVSSESDGISSALEQSLAVADDDIQWLRAGVKDPEAEISRSTTQTAIAQFVSASERSTWAICNYVAMTTTWGPIELSKVVLHPHSWSESSPYQELPLDGAWVPPTLAHPATLYRYTTWLEGAIDKEIDRGHLLKAMRRMVALARLLFWPDLAQKAERFLQTRGKRGKLTARVKLWQDLTALNDPQLESYRTALAAALAPLLEGAPPPERLRTLTNAEWEACLAPFREQQSDWDRLAQIRGDFSAKLASIRAAARD